MRGISSSLELESTETGVRLQVTQRNDTDETIRFRSRSSGPTFLVLDASTCGVVWQEQSNLYSRTYSEKIGPGEVRRSSAFWPRGLNSGRGGIAREGSYLAYALYRFDEPDEVYITPAKTIEVKPIQRATSAGTATAVPVPTIPATAVPVGTDPCELRQRYKSPTRGPLRGVEFSLEFTIYEAFVELRWTQRNSTDETIRFKSRSSEPAYLILDANSCDVVWEKQANLHSNAYEYFSPPSAGVYLAYALYLLAEPEEVYITSPREIRIEAKQQATNTVPGSSLRTIDLGRSEPVSMAGRKLVLRSRVRVDEGGRKVWRDAFFEIDLDTGERREVPKPKRYTPPPERSCTPPQALELVMELDFPVSGGGAFAVAGRAKGALEVNLDAEVAAAFVFTETERERYAYAGYQRLGVVWSDDCRYVAWNIQGSCDLLPHTGPLGAYVHDTQTNRTWVLEESGSIYFWSDLLVVVGWCAIGTTGFFLE